MTRGALLDGFPRSVSQAQVLESVLSPLGKKIDRVIHIDVTEDELVARLTGRRVCRECGSSYHIKFNPPKVRNVCDHCGGELFQREDDSLNTVKERLAVYREQTEPLIQYYSRQGLLSTINGNDDIDEIFARIVEILEAL